MGDPFLKRWSRFSSYNSAGQREAIRGVLTAPPGATLVVNLPTGSGKSLAAYIDGLLHERSLTVVVVPTTALAIDQERATQAYVSHATAYYSDADGDVRNEAIRERIKSGTQRIVFTSPESLVGSLARPVTVAAQNGTLRVLAIDESHIVGHWGDGFRPEFQEIAGLRRNLLRVADGEKPRTLLLTGTMTASCLETLRTLYGAPGPFEVVSSTQLRPEPEYWIATSASAKQRELRVLEAVRHLPRPLLLYVTKVRDAEFWSDALNEAGYRRHAMFTGATGSRNRNRILKRWQNDDLDVVIATSAFGMGVDKRDVRSVVHACVPENVDRFYQEVGRGGRDGRACVSLLLPEKSDWQVARRMSEKTIIGLEKGFSRWRAMIRQSEELPEGRRRVSLRTVPNYRFGISGEKNRGIERWNLKLLMLMARAGAVEFDATDPPGADAGGDAEGRFDPEKFAAAQDRHREMKLLRILMDGLQSKDVWRAQVQPSRERSLCAAREGFRLMEDVAKAEVCLSTLFASAYRISELDGTTVKVAGSCGGCPACRRNGVQPFVSPPPIPLPAWRQHPVGMASEFHPMFGGQSVLYVFDRLPPPWRGGDGVDRVRVLKRLIQGGFRTIAASAEHWRLLEKLDVDWSGSAVFVSEFPPIWQLKSLPSSPAILFDPPDAVLASLQGRTDEDVRRGVVVWLPEGRRDPESPYRELRHTVDGCPYFFDEFRMRLGV